MRFSRVVLTLCVAGMGISAQDTAGEIWQMESKGDAMQALERLQKAADASPQNAGAQRAYAEFLDRHRDPAARGVYAKLEKTLAQNSPERAAVLRRLAILDLVAGDRDAAARDLTEYRAAGGSGLTLPAAPASEPSVSAPKENFVEIPGPLRSFSRMAALAPEMNPEDLLTALARNVVTNGYQAAGSTKRWSRPSILSSSFGISRRPANSTASAAKRR